jgi:hypothetical protein
MSDEELLALKPGDRVIVTDDLGNDKEWTVKYAPWKLGHGDWVIGLKGKAGGYLLSRVQRKIEDVSTP